IAVQALTYFIRCLSDLKRRLPELQPDLAHVHFSSQGSTFRKYFVSRLLYKKNVPYILHAHGGGYHVFYQRVPAFIRHRIDWMLRSSRGLIALSEQWRSFYLTLLGNHPRPIWVMPNPVELPERWQLNSDETLRLLFLGRMDEYKGTERILKAIACLPQPLREQVRLYMAGDGEVDEMRRLAIELGLDAQVDIRDWIEGEDKERWLQETNAFILPSLAEGLPMAMLEAMAYGKALIVSPVGGIPEFVTDGQEGFLVPPENVEAISRAIAKLAENPALRQQMGLAARKRVEPLSVVNYMSQIVEIYRQVILSTEVSSK
ncbi:MAG: glycosyltransferase family 4 protein, partial [Fimbriimonadales bacterium]|nr:glycosyltransferase family 4 protein [Fimbriimonadales bacterium]